MSGAGTWQQLQAMVFKFNQRVFGSLEAFFCHLNLSGFQKKLSSHSESYLCISSDSQLVFTLKSKLSVNNKTSFFPLKDSI